MNGTPKHETQAHCTPRAEREERHGVVIIGSGVGRSIAAFRLAEAGVENVVLERGRRWPVTPAGDTFPAFPSPDRRLVWLDDDSTPFAEFKPPVKMMLDTTKITDGKHKLKIIAKSTDGVEGIKIVPFEVRNGPAIDLVGLKENDVVDDKVTLTINAYGSERKDFFVVTGSETPKGIPSWVWAILITFFGWALFYAIMYWNPENYTSFF
mgnify:CR=1 FL=1